MAHFALMSFHTIYERGQVVEIFAGSCRLSKACKDVGFRATAVDKIKSRSENFNVYQRDLGDPLHLKLLEEYLAAEADTLVHAHFAPSCGTALRAREKRILHLPLDRQPRPLRSGDCPEGLPNLSPKDALRVRLANISYDATMELIEFLVGLGASCSVENPTNSLFWKYATEAWHSSNWRIFYGIRFLYARRFQR